MADALRAQLVQAYNLIKQGNRQAAEELLIGVLRDHADNADAWWLLANTLTDPNEQREALQEVLQLRPGDDKARKMIEKINALHPPQAASPSSSEDDDPFADLLNIAPSPVTSAPKPKAAAFDDDPFAGVPASQPTTQEDDPFAILDKPKAKPAALSARAVSTPAGRTAMTPMLREEAPRRSTSPWLIALVVIAVLILCACAGIFLVINRLGQEVVTVMNEVMPTLMNDPTLVAALNDPAALATLEAGGFNFNFGTGSERLPTDTNPRGNIRAGMSERATVDTFTDDTWKIELAAGTQLTVEVQAMDDRLDPQLFVYGVDNQLVAENDDIDLSGGNRNSRITFTASQGGIYTLLISAFGQGGSYMLVVR